MAAKLDIQGQKFQRLTAVEPVRVTKHGKMLWLFVCECGNSTQKVASEVKNGKTGSCGCLANETRASNSRDNRAKISDGKRKHGLHGSPEYNVWKSMRQRCTRIGCPDYPIYGARGVSVCARWDDFSLFLADMGKRPSDNHSIDRIDSDGNYEPTNCRWATAREQRMNQRRMKERA